MTDKASVSAVIGSFGVRLPGTADVERGTAKGTGRVRVVRDGDGWVWRRRSAASERFSSRCAAYTDAVTRNLDVPLGDFTGELIDGQRV